MAWTVADQSKVPNPSKLNILRGELSAARANLEDPEMCFALQERIKMGSQVKSITSLFKAFAAALLPPHMDAEMFSAIFDSDHYK
jgi:hypothetical protein